jgi:hypothetical protein
LGTLLLIVLIRQTTIIPAQVVWLSSGLAFIISLLAGLRIQHGSPGFIDSTWAVILLSLLLAVIVWCVQRRGKAVTIGLCLLAGLAFVSTANVNPLYRGLQPLTDSLLAKAIDQTGAPDDIWAVSGTRLIVSQPFAEGKKALTGVYIYPQPDMWQKLGKAAPVETYNRFAHVIIDLDTAGEGRGTSLQLKAVDHFTIQTSACSDFLRQSHVKYLITVTPVASQHCASLIRTVTYPTMTLYVYQLLDSPL